MHVIALCTYAGFSNTSLQYNWFRHCISKFFFHFTNHIIYRLEDYLATKINRTETPWLVTIMHAPWYNSNTGHWMEGTYINAENQCFRHIKALNTLSFEIIDTVFVVLQPN